MQENVYTFGVNISCIRTADWNEFVKSLQLSYQAICKLIIKPHNKQLQGDLLAQLVEHCTGISEVKVRIPIQAFLVTA